MAPLTTIQINDDSDCQSQVTMPAELHNKALKKEKRVCFLPQVQAHLILTRAEYTDKELKACWYTQEDKDKRDDRLAKTLARIESGKAPRKGQTYRGLEFYTVEGTRTLKTTIAACIDAVMDEQDKQWKLFRDDYDRLAIASLRTTGHSKKVAFNMAQLDALEAVEAHTEEGLSSSSEHSSSDTDIVVHVQKKQSKDSKKKRRKSGNRGRKVSLKSCRQLLGGQKLKTPNMLLAAAV